VAFVRGEGVYLFDSEGKRYLDLLSGIGVASLGHAHRGLADALAAQARQLVHTSNLFFHPLQGELAAHLARWSGLPPWRWFMERLWLRLKPQSRRLLRMLGWITVAELALFGLLVAILVLEGSG
jgi:hypothetical protein